MDFEDFWNFHKFFSLQIYKNSIMCKFTCVVKSAANVVFLENNFELHCSLHLQVIALEKGVLWYTHGPLLSMLHIHTLYS